MLPDDQGHFGQFGGRYASETLMPALLELEAAYREAQADESFLAEFTRYAAGISIPVDGGYLAYNI